LATAGACTHLIFQTLDPRVPERAVCILKHGVSYGHIAEVRDADEARVILNYYREIIGKIEKQLGKDSYVATAVDLRRNIS
jgi:hypothetical protein